MFFACGIWCVADVSSVRPLSEQTDDATTLLSSDEGLMLEMLATYHIKKHTI